MNEVTAAQLTAAGVPATFLDPVMDGLERSDAMQPHRAACWVAQCGHESEGFTRLAENLNYSADRLLVVFPRYFRSMTEASAYHRQPERIANRVYGGRLGNGPESTGDGFKFRGRGAVQCTGRDNYAQCSRWLYGDDRLLLNPERLERPEEACLAGAWYWVTRQLNRHADAQTLDAYRAMTKAINGGLTGLDDRIARLQRARAAFGLVEVS